MANPNKALEPNSKYFVTAEWIFPKWLQAQSFADDLRKTGKHAMVRVTGFNIGPRRNPIRKFIVRTYGSL